MKVVSILMSFFHKWAFFLGRPIVSIFLGIVSIILLYMSQHVSGINLLEYYPHILVQLRHSQMFCDTGKKWENWHIGRSRRTLKNKAGFMTYPFKMGRWHWLVDRKVLCFLTLLNGREATVLLIGLRRDLIFCFTTTCCIRAYQVASW